MKTNRWGYGWEIIEDNLGSAQEAECVVIAQRQRDENWTKYARFMVSNVG